MFAVDPVDDSLVHIQDVRSSTDLRMDAHRENECIIMLIAILELFFPLALDRPGIHVAVLVCLVSIWHHSQEQARHHYLHYQQGHLRNLLG